MREHLYNRQFPSKVAVSLTVYDRISSGHVDMIIDKTLDVREKLAEEMLPFWPPLKLRQSFLVVKNVWARREEEVLAL